MPVITSFFFPTTFKLGLKERKKESKGDENDKDVMENGLHKTSEKQNAWIFVRNEPFPASVTTCRILQLVIE